MTDHDPLCPWGNGKWPDNRDQCRCALISKVRADGRKRMEVDWNGPARADIRRALRADLRTQVEALRMGMDGGYADAIDAVLALIDGSSE